MREGSPDALQITILPQFLAIEPYFVRKGSPDALQIAILPQFLAIEPHFVGKGRAGRFANRNFTSDRTSFRAKGLRPDKRNRNSNIPCEKVRRTLCKIAILLQFLATEPHFVRKGCTGQLANRNFTSVFGDQTSCRAKRLRFVPSRWHCPAPSREK